MLWEALTTFGSGTKARLMIQQGRQSEPDNQWKCAFLWVVLVWFKVERNEERRFSDSWVAETASTAPATFMSFPPASWAHTRLHFRDCLMARGAYDWALVNRMGMEMAYPSSNLSHLLLIKCRRFQDLENRGARWKESRFLGDYVENRTTLFSTHLDCNVSLESNFCATWIWELFLHIISLHWRIRNAEFD